MLWLTCVVIGGLAFTLFVVMRHGFGSFSVFLVENTIMTMTTGGLLFGTGAWGVLKLVQ